MQFDTRGQEPAAEYHFCTYFDRNYLSRGLALYDSLGRHCKRPFTLWILCFDDETYGILSSLGLAELKLISLQEFEEGDQALVGAKAERSIAEYYWTCTPSLPLYVFRQNRHVHVVTYLDADLYFYSDPQPIYDEFGDGSILLVGHRYAPQHAHLAISAGVYNVGLLAFRHDAHGLDCLQWWREKCIDWCYKRFEDGKFGDQKYLDDWPERFQGVVVVQHPGAGLAPWNLPNYRIEFARRGVAVDGQPLIYYHFHGYENINNCVVKPAPPRYRISPNQTLKLYLPYARALRRHRTLVERLLSDGVPTRDSVSALGIARGLLTQRLLLIRPASASLVLWFLGAWLQGIRSRIRGE